MEIDKIPSAERLFQLLSTYERMQLMLQSKSTSPVKIRLEQTDGTLNYVSTDDPDGIALFETLVASRIADIKTLIGEL